MSDTKKKNVPDGQHITSSPTDPVLSYLAKLLGTDIAGAAAVLSNALADRKPKGRNSRKE